MGRVRRLSSQGAEVLYLTYNITIINELRLRFSKLEGNRNGNITWLNYHDWCKKISFQFGFESEWSSRFSGADESEEAFEGVGEFILNQISNLKIDDSHKFDALIIDEAQDMSADWIKAALLILRNGGELIIAADTRQDIYNRSQDWTQDQINGLGFRGPWLTLSNSYRTPSYLVPLINNFKERFANNSSHMEGTEPNIVAISNDQLSLDDKLDLFECNNDDLSKKTFEVVHNLIEQDKNALSGQADRSVEDIVILVPNKKTGADLAVKLAAKKIKIDTTFEFKGRRGNLSERDLKLDFSTFSGKVKISTIHSFKGMSCSRLLLVLNKNSSPNFKKIVYVGLSRLKSGELGQSLFVVSSNTELNSFFRSFKF